MVHSITLEMIVADRGQDEDIHTILERLSGQLTG